MKVKAIGAVAYPAVFAVSFLLVFLGVSLLASSIKRTDLEQVLTGAITVVALVCGSFGNIQYAGGWLVGQHVRRPSLPLIHTPRPPLFCPFSSAT